MSTTLSAQAVSVLNASNLPVGHTKLRRALALVIDGYAEIHESDPFRVIKSNSGVTFPFPRAIRLLKLIAVPFDYRPEFFSRTGVLKRDNFTCGYCGKTAKDGVLMTHDHILPKSRGGSDDWMNAITACVDCNGLKGNRTPEEAGMPLLFQPSVPMKIYMRSNKPRRKKKK